MFRGQPAPNQGRQRRAQPISFPAPTGGWISNRNLAQPNGQDMSQGAEILENYFPTAAGAILRRGCAAYAQLGDGSGPATSLFKYVVGNNRRLFGATATTVYDITTIRGAYNYTLSAENGALLAMSPAANADTIGENSTAGLEVWEGAAGGEWITVQFSTTGGTYLIGVNGSSEGFRFDGTDFAGLDTASSAAITFPTGSGLTSADLSYVWAYKNRLWFVEKESLNVWYLPVDSIGGTLVRLRLGGELNKGGSILIGATWSLEGGAQGGLSEQCIFISTEGEVAVFQGADPAQAATWSKVGVYQVGTPLGKKGIIRAGGDLIVATSIGDIPLSKAVSLDFAAIAPAAVSSTIETAWTEAYQARGDGWHCILWPEGQMMIVSPPTTPGTSPILFIANALTGAWCSFTNWQATCMEVFGGRLFFGSVEGRIYEAMVGGTDDGIPYTGSYMPMFSDGGSPSSLKAARIARVTTRSGAPINERVSCRFDFDKKLPPPPDVLAVPSGNEWNNGIWDQSVWSVEREAIITQRRHSVSGRGYRIAPTFQVTSGSTVPLDVEIISLDVTFDVGDIFT